MLESTEKYIKELLTDDEKYQELEKKINNLIPEKLATDGVNDENINTLIKLENIIIEKAYLKGYKDGLTESVKERIIDDVERYITVSKLSELMD